MEKQEITCYTCKYLKVAKQPHKEAEAICKKEVWTTLDGDSYKYIMDWEGKCKKYENQNL